MAAKSLEARIQDLVYNVDVGIGLRLIKTALYLLFVFFVVLLYTANQFKGLRDAEAMDSAQLGRNFMSHRELVTQNVRPASIWFLTRGGNLDPRIHHHPDVVHAPLYPVMLGVWFRITGAQFDVQTGGPLDIVPPEYHIMVLNHIFALLTGLLLYLTGRRLFDPLIALLGVSLYFLSDTVWRSSLSGTGVSVVSFWAMAAIFSMVIAVTRLQEEPDTRRWMVPALFSTGFCVLAFLTRYGAIALVPGLAIYLGWALGRRGWVWAVAFIAVFLIGISPWIVRNVMVSQSPLGLAPYLALNDTNEFRDNAFERSLYPAVDAGTVWRAVRGKSIRNLQKFYNDGLRTLGDGFLIALFLTTFFYRFVRFPVHALRWGVALSLLLLLFISSLYGEATFSLMLMFWPLIILYALAFFTLLLDRLQLQIKLLNMAVTATLMALSALPMVFTLLPPRATPPYPPYAPGLISYVSNLLRPNELMCTDMSWATAWYGGRTSVLLPATVEEFYDINDYMHRFSGLYFTPVTRDKSFVRTLRSPAYVTWLPILEGRIPTDFPLAHGVPLGGIEQLFLSDRPRWEEQAP